MPRLICGLSLALIIAACTSVAPTTTPTIAPTITPAASPAPTRAPTRDATRVPTSPTPLVQLPRRATPTIGSSNEIVLDANHPGWKTQNCQMCHTTLPKQHPAASNDTCATCHGGNGACIPSAARPHTPTDNCLSCHPAMHGIQPTTACVTCHFASVGVVACDGVTSPGTGKLQPATALKSNCLNLPAQAISPTNHAKVTTALTAGKAAVDFTLLDVEGKAYTLRDLLQTKPVLLVLGGFT